MPEQDSETLYVHPLDRKRHFAIIHEIATVAQRPLDEVAQCYEEILRELKTRARIADFVPIFVAKKVWKLYDNRHDVT